MGSNARDKLVLVGLVGVLAAAAYALGCGGVNAVCGDGETDDGEQCDDGNTVDNDYCNNNCNVNQINRFYVLWEFNKDAAPQFTGDSCLELGVINVEVRLYGNGIDETQTGSCSERQAVFEGLPHELPAGLYSIAVRPLSGGGDLLISAPFEGSYQFAHDTRVEVVIPPDAWINDYIGTIYFKLNWGGADCTAAAPPVSHVLMTLTQDGTPVSATTQAGDSLNGAAEGPCRPASGGAQSALDLPFGPAEFTVVGRETSGGEATFQETFETFVGAGDFNPEYLFDVNSTAPDAGVPDAGIVDAGVADAGVDAGA